MNRRIHYRSNEESAAQALAVVQSDHMDGHLANSENHASFVKVPTMPGRLPRKLETAPWISFRRMFRTIMTLCADPRIQKDLEKSAPCARFHESHAEPVART